MPTNPVDSSRCYQLAQLVKNQREHLALSLREVAQQVGVSSAMLSRIELVGISAHTETLLRLAQVLQVDQDALLLLGHKLPLDIKEALFSGPLSGRLRILKALRRKLTTAAG